MRIIVLLLLVLSQVLALRVWAADDLKAREDISEKARARLYDGGADEQPLVVQQSLVEPRADGSETLLQRKIINSEDNNESESTDETSSGF